MKRILTFIPLGIGISSTIIYIFNIISFRTINNTVAMNQILSNLRIYLYIAIISFIIYGILKIIFFKSFKKNIVVKPKTVKEKPVVIKQEVKEEEKEEKKIIKQEEAMKEAYEPFDTINELNNEQKISIFKNYCFHCGKEVYNEDIYCRNCGYKLEKDKKRLSPFIKNVINVIEIVIMILIIYFIINVLLDYKHSINPSFKSPFNITMTK